MNSTRVWKGIWIKASTVPENQVPYLRKTFDLEAVPKKVSAFICSAGWHVLTVNGKRPDDRELAPSVSQYDKRVFYIEYDIAKLLKPGKNVILLELGNSLYNDNSHAASDFIRATWRDKVKVLCDIAANGTTIVKSDRSWKTAGSPTIFNNIRCGERYNATQEIAGLHEAEFDDSTWSPANAANPPGGVIVEENAPPCRIVKRFPPKREYQLGPFMKTFDFEVNMAGRCEFTFKGRRGKEVRIFYGERIRENGDVDREHISLHTPREEGFQEERYILKGEGEETWHSNFTYHGFRCVKLRWEGPDSVEIVKIEACFIHTDFEICGKLETSNSILNKLQAMTLQSYLSNFTGIPTDCPHREKNGWTGDAQLAMQTGCWNFNVERACSNFLTSFLDVQRPNGQLPSVVPTGGFGWNWGNGPAWDALLFEYPWQMYLFYGNTENITGNYDKIRRYLDYLSAREEDGILNFGMSDWASWEPRENFISTAYYYHFCNRMIRFTEISGYAGDVSVYREKAGEVRANFNRAFYRGNGQYAGGEMTSQAAPIFFGIVEDSERDAAMKRLVETVRQAKHHPEFGILGAKMVPRVLSENGYIDDVYRMFTQTEYPGWGFWAASGSTTLWEGWSGTSSLNHIMYGDISAWIYEYLGGIRPDWKAPAFAHFSIRPYFPGELSSVSVEYRSPKGLIRSSWKRSDGKLECCFSIPESASADLILPDRTVTGVSGELTFSCNETIK